MLRNPTPVTMPLPMVCLNGLPCVLLPRVPPLEILALAMVLPKLRVVLPLSFPSFYTPPVGLVILPIRLSFPVYIVIVAIALAPIV